MAYEAQKVNYCYVTVSSRAGSGAGILQALKEAGISLLAFSGFPTKGGKAQVDLVAEKLGPIQKVARKQGWKLSKPKKGFLIRGTDEVGAIEQPISALGAKGSAVLGPQLRGRVCGRVMAPRFPPWVPQGHWADHLDGGANVVSLKLASVLCTPLDAMIDFQMVLVRGTGISIYRRQPVLGQ